MPPPKRNTALAPATHECPANGCAIRIRRSLLSCRRHWFDLPEPIRREIWRAYRARKTDPAAHDRAVAEALAFYRGEAVAEPAG